MTFSKGCSFAGHRHLTRDCCCRLRLSGVFLEFPGVRLHPAQQQNRKPLGGTGSAAEFARPLQPPTVEESAPQASTWL